MQFLHHHPQEYKTGTRVLFLKARNKDGHDRERTVFRISMNERRFDQELEALTMMSKPNERIYCSASARSLKKAARIFEERQFAARFNLDPLNFYASLNDSWASCLMKPSCVEKGAKRWLLDCDSEAERSQALRELHNLGIEYYSYNSKSEGSSHLVMKPFDRSKLTEETRAKLDYNPVMLWAW